MALNAAFITPNGPRYPDFGKVQKYGIKRLYWQANDPQIDALFFDEMRKSTEVGLLRDPGWTTSSAVDLARLLDADLVRLGSANKQCAVIADIERHDPWYVYTWLHEWRALRPLRVSAWTMEPFQGGWMDKALVDAANADPNLQVIHQNYLGTPRMYPAAADEVRADLLRRGLREDRLLGFYDAEQPIPSRWNGVIFNFNALP